MVVLLASSLAAIAGTASASSPSYQLLGYVEQPGGVLPVPPGVQVELTSRATGATFTTTTTAGGQFSFSTASTGGALRPGWWAITVPVQTSVSLTGCSPCAVLPGGQSPLWTFQTASNLTNSGAHAVTYPNVAILPYNATVSGTVTSAGAPVTNGLVRVLAPSWGNVTLASAATNTTTGAYAISIPRGTWVVESSYFTGAQTLYNFSRITLSPTTSAVTLNPRIQQFVISGFVTIAPGGTVRVPTPGNVTVLDTTNGYLYSDPIAPGGFYSFGTYPSNFTSAGTGQTFTVILSAVGYQTQFYNRTVATPGAVSQNVAVPPVLPTQLLQANTVINLTGVNTAKAGQGTIVVTTFASLGNDTVIPSLANASVGQLWAQLGLDYEHHPWIPAADLAGTIGAFEQSRGPFFPARQAGFAINGTTLLAPAMLGANYTMGVNGCTTLCGLSTGGNLTFSFAQQYALNGSIRSNATSYTLSFGFRHPASGSSGPFNYTLALPTGYVLQSGTTAPASTRLAPAGPGGTWTRFTLTSFPTATATAGSATFTIVKYAAPVANVNISSPNFTFSTANVLNRTHGNYTVVVGPGRTIFSALNSSYPAGTNGTRFTWNFGDGSPTVTTRSAVTNHTYTTPTTGATPYTGWLNVTSSGGLTANTTFHVWVVGATNAITARISTNASARSYRTTVGNTSTYLFVNYSSLLRINASRTTAITSPGAPSVPGVRSIAYFVVQSSSNRLVANYSVSQGAAFGSNLTVTFGLNPPAGRYYNLSTIRLNGGLTGLGYPSFGWWYNVTLTAWDGAGHSNTTTLTVLVNDTQAPLSRFTLLGANGLPVPASGLIEGANGTARVMLNAANSTDPNNGTIVQYQWNVSNRAAGAWHNGTNRTWYYNTTTVRPYPSLWLPPAQTPYRVNLTVVDLNRNRGTSLQTVSVSINATTRPIMSATNLTSSGGPTLTQGSSTTLSVFIKVGGGAKSVANNVSVWFYLMNPSGTGSRSSIVNNASIQYYNYTASNSSVWTTPWNLHGASLSLPYNTTVVAKVAWSPGKTGSFNLYANVTASNEYPGSYNGGANVAVLAITVNPSPSNTLVIYGGIAAAAVVIILAIALLWRRRSRRAAGGGPSRPAGRGGLERPRKDDDED